MITFKCALNLQIVRRLHSIYVLLLVVNCSLFSPFSMSSLRQNVQKEDKVVKESSSHTSQKDAAKGFGGKYGVMKERQDKVGTNLCCINQLFYI